MSEETAGQYGVGPYGAGTLGQGTLGEGELGDSEPAPDPYIESFEADDVSLPAQTRYDVSWTVGADEKTLDTVVITLHNEAGDVVQAVSYNVERQTATATHTIRTWGGADTLRLTVSSRSNVATTAEIDI